jgi:hypothetical protein
VIDFDNRRDKAAAIWGTIVAMRPIDHPAAGRTRQAMERPGTRMA